VLNRTVSEMRPDGSPTKSPVDSAPKVVALPSALPKQLKVPDAKPADPTEGLLADLKALAEAGNWRELGDRLPDVRAALRDATWKSLVEQAAIGELTALSIPSDRSYDERLALLNRYYPRYRSLAESPKFLSLRATIGLQAYADCFNQRGDGRNCRDGLEGFIRVPPHDLDLVRKATRLVSVRFNWAAGAPYFASILTGPESERVCKEAGNEVADAAVAGLQQPPEGREAGAARLLIEKCWDAVKVKVVDNVGRESAESYYLRNACSTLMKYEAVTGLRAKRCQALLAQ
jgi:hypothetical protein